MARARQLRLLAAACALLAAILLGAAIVLNENAVNYEDRVTGDGGSYVTGVALVLALLAGLLAVRSAANPEAREVHAPGLVGILAFVAAVLGGLANGTESVFVNVQVCVASHHGVWLAVYMKPTPGSCPPYQIPISEESLFYPGMFAALAAAVVLVACLVLLRIGRKRWAVATTQSAPGQGH